MYAIRSYYVKYLGPEDADFISIDWQVPLDEARQMLHPGLGVQGNLDPRILLADPVTIGQKLETFLEFGAANDKWIFNVGHGFIPGIPVENASYNFV